MNIRPRPRDAFISECIWETNDEWAPYSGVFPQHHHCEILIVDESMETATCEKCHAVFKLKHKRILDLPF